MSQIHKNHWLLPVKVDVCGRFHLFNCLHHERQSRHKNMDFALHNQRSIQYENHSGMVHAVDHRNAHWFHLRFDHDYNFVVFCFLLLLYCWHLWTLRLANLLVERRCWTDPCREKSIEIATNRSKDESKIHRSRHRSHQYIRVSWHKMPWSIELMIHCIDADFFQCI